MSKNVIASTGPSVDQIAARSVPIPEHPTLAATETEPVQGKGQPAPVHEVRQPEAPGDNALDQFLHSSLARLTGGLSPAAIAEAYFVWATHLAFSPGKQQELLKKAVEKWLRLINQAQKQGFSDRAAPCITPLPQDRRFADDAWQRWPFSLIYQGFSAKPTMVAQCHQGRRRRQPAARGGGRIRYASTSRHVLTVEFSGNQS